MFPTLVIVQLVEVRLSCGAAAAWEPLIRVRTKEVRRAPNLPTFIFLAFLWVVEAWDLGKTDIPGDFFVTIAICSGSGKETEARLAK